MPPAFVSTDERLKLDAGLNRSVPSSTAIRSAKAVWPFSVSVPLVGVLVLALVGLVFVEQIYRNVEPQQRWALKFLVIVLGVMFAYDIFLYSYAVLYRQFNLSAWAARGFINALLVPLLTNGFSLYLRLL